MKALVALMCLVACPAIVSAQYGWEWQNPHPQGSFLFSVEALAANTAVAVGEDGLILRSTDRGATWSANWARTRHTFFGLAFSDDNIGVAVGDVGFIHRTSDGGITWHPHANGAGIAILSGVDFAGPSTAVAVGSNGTIVRTDNGGVNWAPVASGTSN